MTTSDGIVTLSGTVDNLLAKDRARRIAEAVKGVRAVINKISVVPTLLRTDSEIRDNVEDALLMDPVTEFFKVDVKVKDSAVTLSGTVDSFQEKWICEKVVKGVKGVKEVNNQLIVDSKETRTDREIQVEVEEVLKWDVLVNHVPITVEVRDGTVYLSGVVGSAAEKRQARIDAYAAGVRSVDTTGLKIQNWANDPKMRKRAYVKKTDAEIERAVKDALLYDPRVSSLNVSVEVSDGQVTLRGEVGNLEARRAAGSDAWNTVGVTGVFNRLRIKPAEQISDTKLERRVLDALTQNPYLDRFDIVVDVINGRAYLYGDVNSYFEKATAERAASKILGVVSVENNLKVQQDYTPHTYDPYVDELYPGDYNWYRYSPTYGLKSDSQIKKDIEDELWWSPFVDEEEITVTVRNGVATLTGAVDSWSEYRAAAENAYEGGAVLVRNELLVIEPGAS